MSREWIVEATIAKYDWSSVNEIEGPAVRIPEAFLELLDSSGPEAAVSSYWKLDNHVVVQGALFESSVCVVSLIGAALANPTRPKWVRIQLLELLFQIVSGESHSEEVARGITDLGQQCREEAKKLIWVLYGILQNGELSRAAREILELIDVGNSLLIILDSLERKI